jgi:hypothetical protein
LGEAREFPAENTGATATVAPPPQEVAAVANNNQENVVGAGEEVVKMDLFDSSDDQDDGGGKVVQGKQVRTGKVLNRSRKHYTAGARRVTTTERKREGGC